MTNKVAALYQFLRLEQPAAVRDEFFSACTELGIFGTILVSPEGINGTIAGAAEAIDAFVARLRVATDGRPAFERLELKFSTAGAAHFDRLKIKLKREIITFGQTVDESTKLGQYLAPREWNALLEDPDVVLVDTRNGFEVGFGTFEGAIDPGLTSFTGFKDFVNEKLADAKNKKIAMFCTGGIRCEKASAFMLEAGFSQVFQLQGGILRYLEEMPEPESKWRGECFVFDQRVALGHGLCIRSPDGHANFLDTARGKIAE